MSYAWDLDGDGTTEVVADHPVVAHVSTVYRTPRWHKVKLVVTGSNGKTDETTRTIRVAANDEEQKALDKEAQKRKDERPQKPAGAAVVTVNGWFLYTDAYQNQPWSLQLGGNLLVYGDDVGNGSLTVRPSGSIDFDFAAHFDIGGVASLDGQLSGWIEAAVKRFNVDGSIRACLGKLCATSVTVISSTGLSSCLDLGHINYWVPVKKAGWRWYRPWLVSWVEHTLRLEAGFGYRWSGSIRLFGGSCDLAPYRAERPAAQTAQAGDGFAIDVARGTPALTLRILGGAAPPKVTLHGPDGTVITSPAEGSAAQPGHWTLVENPTDGSTGVVLIAPSPGRWTITPPRAARSRTSSPRVTSRRPRSPARWAAPARASSPPSRTSSRPAPR